MELALAVCALLALLVPLLFFSSSKRRRLAEVVDRIPGPFSLPVIGTSYRLLSIRRKEFFSFADKVSRQYSPIFRIWRGPLPEVHICTADHAEEIFNSSINLEKSTPYRFLQPWLGKGLLTSEGRKWHSRRKLITPTFHFKILENFVNVFVEKSEILVKKLEKEAGHSKGFDVYPYIALCALDIISETAMGTEVNAQDNANSPYVSAIYEISELTVERMTRPWLYNEFIYSLTSSGKKYVKHLNTLHAFTNKVIRERKQSYACKPKQEDIQEEEVLGKKKRMAFLDLLLEASEGETLLTEEDIREEVDTFMFEGHDTTAASLCWTLFLLGNNPEVQDRVFEEMEQIFQGSDRPPTMKDLSEMKYLERVIKESLRLYPSVPFIGRKITQEVKAGQYTLPVGAEINVHIYHIHRNPTYFPNPDEFNPDNFLPERVQGRHPFAYVPFSAGSRNCIGQKFALLEEKTILSYVARNYKIRSLDKPSGVNVLAELVLRPEDGIKLTLERR